MVNFEGRNGLPEMRGILTVAWSKGDWDAYYQMEYVDSMYESSSFDVPTLTSSASGDLKSHSIHNIQVSYTAPTNTTLTLGIRNFQDKDPVIDSNYEWNSYLYDIYGRTTTFKIEHRF